MGQNLLWDGIRRKGILWGRMRGRGREMGWAGMSCIGGAIGGKDGDRRFVLIRLKFWSFAEC